MLLTGSDLERVLAGLGVRAPVRADEVTGSTNRTALEMAEEGAPEWTLVAAGHQTEGRGRLGRAWEDVPGRAVLLSVVLRPDALPAERGGVIPLIAGLSMAGAIRDVARLPAVCKWPNDLLVDGRKVGGILAESRVTGDETAFAVVGLGVNLDPPEEGWAGLGAVDAVALVAAFLGGFRARYPPARWELPTEEYEAVCATLGRTVAATRLDGRTVRGRAIGVGADGSLVVRTDEGDISVAFGEIQHLDG